MARSSNYTLNKNYWYVADFETVTPKTEYFKINQDTKVLLFSIQKYNTNDNYINGVEIDEFINFFLELKKSATCFFHNLSFDGDFIVKYLQQKTRFKLNYLNEKKTGFKFFRQNNRIYYIEINYKTRNKNGNSQWIKIIFRCSLLLLSASVSQLAKSVGMVKNLEQDDMVSFYDREPFERLESVDMRYLDYCNNDVNVVNKCLSNFVASINSLEPLKKYNENRLKKRKTIFNPFHYLTAGSLAIGLLKNIYLKNYNAQNNTRVTLDIDEKTYDYIRPFYSGGWTQFNPDFNGEPKPVNDGVFIDVNSAYPFQMAKELPYGDLLEQKPPVGYNYYTFMTVKVFSAKIKKEFENVVILKNWKKEVEQKELRYVRHLKNFMCFYILEEWEILNKYYDIKFEWIEYKYMLKRPWAREYINDLYYWKNKHKQDGNNAFALTFKILLNASYGKLGSRKKFDSLFYLPKKFFGIDGENIGDSEYLEISKNLRTKLFNVSDKEYKFKYASANYKIDTTLLPVLFEPMAEKEALPNIAAAAVITALERVYLWQTILELGPEKFIYSDTDSIAFRDLKDNQLKNYVGDELGKWDVEFRFNEFGCFGVKKYKVLNNGQEIKFKFAGMNKIKKELEYMNFDNDILQIKDATLIRKNVKSGIILIKSDKQFTRGNI